MSAPIALLIELQQNHIKHENEFMESQHSKDPVALNKLAKSSHLDVRSNVARNKFTSIETLNTLKDDQDKHIAWEALNSLAIRKNLESFK